MLQDIPKTVLQSSNEELQLITSHSKYTYELSDWWCKNEYTGKKLSAQQTQLLER